jgi:hypothetical protein
LDFLRSPRNRVKAGNASGSEGCYLALAMSINREMTGRGVTWVLEDGPGRHDVPAQETGKILLRLD